VKGKGKKGRMGRERGKERGEQREGRGGRENEGMTEKDFAPRERNGKSALMFTRDLLAAV